MWIFEFTYAEEKREALARLVDGQRADRRAELWLPRQGDGLEGDRFPSQVEIPRMVTGVEPRVGLDMPRAALVAHHA